MRILHYIDSLRLGGKERQSVELLKGLSQRKGVELLLVCMGQEDFYKREIDALRIPSRFLIRRVRWDPCIFLRFFRTVTDFRPDIIHTTCWMTSSYALPVSKLFRIRLINGSIRNAFSTGGIKWKLEKLLVACSDFRVANSEAGLSSRSFSLSSERNVVIHNGFDLSRLQRLNNPKETKSLLGINGKQVVGMVAEFSDYKDYKSYMLAAQKVLSMRNDVIFVAVGHGKNLKSCKQMVAGHNDRLLFLGARKDVEQIVSTFDVGVLSTFTEGISNSIMEYMALGKPVVATNGGGTEEIVLEGVTGFLVAQTNPKDLAAKIEYFLDNPEVAKKMGEAGKKRIEEAFSLDLMVENTLRLYKMALSKRGLSYE